MIQNHPRTSEEIEAQLRKWSEDAEAIMRLYLEGRQMVASRVPEARDLFRTLKEELDTEYRRMDTIKGEASLSRLASAFYRPAVQDAWANSGLSSVRWNSRPDHTWFDALYQVRFYMRYWSNDLKQLEKEPQAVVVP